MASHSLPLLLGRHRLSVSKPAKVETMRGDAMPRALFRGPSHVLVSIDDSFRALIGDEAIGKPYVEAFVTANAARPLEVMNRVYRTGVAETFRFIRADGDEGIVTVVPILRGSAVFGVATDWQPVRAPIAQRLLQPLGLLSALLVLPIPI